MPNNAHCDASIYSISRYQWRVCHLQPVPQLLGLFFQCLLEIFRLRGSLLNLLCKSVPQVFDVREEQKQNLLSPLREVHNLRASLRRVRHFQVDGGYLVLRENKINPSGWRCKNEWNMATTLMLLGRQAHPHKITSFDLGRRKFVVSKNNYIS